MADVGVLGLGKLGLVFALVLDVHGKHRVTGCDMSRHPLDIISGKAVPPQEVQIDNLLALNRMNVVNDPATLVANADTIFVAVQTPHPAHLDGTVPNLDPETRRDFDYAYLINAVRSLARAADMANKAITIAVISTVLPGTCDRLLRPLLNDHTRLVYTPSLISLGSVADDLLNPEFVIVGADTYEDEFRVEKIVEIGRAHV